MYVIVATLHAKPQFRDALLQAVLDDAKGSLQNEPGCLRFDVVHDEQNPNRIFLYEVYKDKAAFDVHAQSPHMVKFRNTVKDDWFETPRSAARCMSLFPSDKDWR